MLSASDALSLPLHRREYNDSTLSILALEVIPKKGTYCTL